MKDLNLRTFFVSTGLAAGSILMASCGAQPGMRNVNLANANSRPANSVVTNSNTNSTNVNSVTSSSTVETKEPEQYQALVTVKVEAFGDQQKTALPTLVSNVARNSTDRRMEFTMPGAGKVVFLDKAGKNYLILPDKRQYAELTPESLGFEVRRMLMPEQIVAQVKNVPGMGRAGEEKYNGRDAVKYRYGAVANTQTQAGHVGTESFLLVDKDTGLPLHSETTTQSQSGANVQGFNGVRIVTEITDIKTDTSPALFDLPTDFQEIDSAQVRAQVDMIFNTLAAFAAQMMKQAQPAATLSASPEG